MPAHFGFPAKASLVPHRPFVYCPYCTTPLVLKLQMNEERPACPNCGWVYYEDPKVAAGVLVYWKEQVLLVRRTMEPYAGLWSIPAGFVNAYEDPANAAARECIEETGLTPRVESLFEMLTGREHPRGADILLVYRASIVEGKLQAADDADRAEWIPLASLPPLAFNSTHKILARLARELHD
jgi:ADP-ribose pyrophosphatase YjhB (NUDIX family)